MLLHPSGPVEVETKSVWQDPASGLHLGIPVGFSDLWEEAGKVYMAIVCTGEVDFWSARRLASTKFEGCDPHIAIARKAVDACVDSEHGMVALLGEALTQFCVDNSVRSVRQIPPRIRPFVHKCLRGLQDTTPDMREVEEARQAKRALVADGMVVHFPAMDVSTASTCRSALQRCLDRAGYPGARYRRAEKSNSTLVVFSFDDNIPGSGAAGAGGEDGASDRSGAAGGGADRGGEGAAGGSGAAGGGGSDDAASGSAFRPDGVAYDAVSDEDGDGDSPTLDWVPLVAGVSLPSSSKAHRRESLTCPVAQQCTSSRVNGRRCSKKTKDPSGLCYWHKPE